VERASALLRTRVDIATETQNQMLLEKLTKGQDLQLRLQSHRGRPVDRRHRLLRGQPDFVCGQGWQGGRTACSSRNVLAGALIPLVLLGVWWGTRQIHKKLKHSDQD
jgi:uncharacterized membrane-anchored protein